MRFFRDFLLKKLNGFATGFSLMNDLSTMLLEPPVAEVIFASANVPHSG